MHLRDAIDRASWLRVLTLSAYEDLADWLSTLAPLPPFEFVHGPEVGLAMVRGRAGGEGEPFDLGEMPVTRCRLRVFTSAGEEKVGHAVVAGRDPLHAEVVALCDAMLQSSSWSASVVARVLAPAERLLAERREQNAQRRAATTLS